MTEYTESNAETLRVVKLSPAAVVPQRATQGSVGYDLCACMEAPVTIAPGARVLFPTGLALQLPQNTGGMLFTRSGLGVRHGIHVTNGVGVIDWDYRGEVGVSLHNLSDTPYTVQPRERIAQLVVIPVLTPAVEVVAGLENTTRGGGGFGSTGRQGTL